MPAPIAPTDRPSISFALTLLLAFCTGTIVANLYYAQPLVGLIGAALHLPDWAVGLVVTLIQIGYGVGLAFVVPLGDLVENRKLIVATLIFNACSLIGLTLTTSVPAFFAFAFLVGVTTTSVQMIIPLAAHLAPPHQRGAVVGNVMSGLLMGIMLSRPTASFLAQYGSWRFVFGLSSVVMVVLAVLLFVVLRPFPRHTELTYRKILASLGPLLANTPELRRRGAYHAALFGAFSLFWTAVPLFLSGPTFGLNQQGIGFFALVGAAGAFIAPIAGRVADRGLIQPATGAAMLLALLAFGILAVGGTQHSMPLLIAGAILLDASIAMNLILSQRVIYGLAADVRARLNGIFMALFFLGGAIGSALASFAYAAGGWPASCAAGAGFVIFALLAYVTEFNPLHRRLLLRARSADETD